MSEPEPRPLRDSVDEVVRSLRGTGARSLAGVFGRWDEAVGAQVAADARPASLIDGCLLVDVDHPTWATQLRFSSPSCWSACARSPEWTRWTGSNCGCAPVPRSTLN